MAEHSHGHSEGYAVHQLHDIKLSTSALDSHLIPCEIRKLSNKMDMGINGGVRELHVTLLVAVPYVGVVTQSILNTSSGKQLE